MAGYVQALTTTDSQEDAERIARSVVEARLAACAQVLGPVKSTYWWQGEVQSADELLILMKTTEEKAGALVDHVKATHSHDVPEVIVTPITSGNPDYLSWLTAETSAR